MGGKYLPPQSLLSLVGWSGQHDCTGVRLRDQAMLDGGFHRRLPGIAHGRVVVVVVEQRQGRKALVVFAVQAGSLGVGNDLLERLIAFLVGRCVWVVPAPHLLIFGSAFAEQVLIADCFKDDPA